MDTQGDFVRCKVQHCTPIWDPIIATLVSQEQVFANSCELGCYFQVTGVEEKTVELNPMPLDNSLRPTHCAACLRAWKHVLFDDWAILDPELTEKDPLPLWFTSLYNSPEMDASEAETVLAWCLKEELPVENQIPGRHILAEMHSLVPPPGQITNNVLDSSNILDITKSGIDDNNSGDDHNNDSGFASRMEQFPEINPSLIVNIDSGDISTEPSSEPLITFTPNEDASSNGSAVDQTQQQQQQQQQQGIDESTLIIDPPTLNTVNKPNPTPSLEDDQQQASPPSSNNVDDEDSIDSAPSPEDTTNDENSTPSKTPNPSSKPENNDNTNDNNSNDGSQGDNDVDGDGSIGNEVDNNNNTNNDSSGSTDPSIDDYESTTTGDDDTQQNQGDSADSTDGSSSNNGNNFSRDQEGGNQGEEISLEDLAIPGDYKPVIIEPEYTVDEYSSNSGVDQPNTGIADPETLLQAGGVNGAAADGSATAADGSGSANGEETPALPQLAMSQTSSATPARSCTSTNSVIGAALLAATAVMMAF